MCFVLSFASINESCIAAFDRLHKPQPWCGVKTAIVAVSLSAFSSCLLAGCASIKATPLAADGLNAVPGAQPGFRYYIPRPYLLVAEMPATKAGASGKKKSNQGKSGGDAVTGNASIGVANIGTANIGTANIGTANIGAAPPSVAPGAAPSVAPGAAPSAAQPSAADDTSKKSNSTGAASADAGSAPATDTSFVATNGTSYIMKLVYLPDYSRPMAVEVDSGILGISKADLTLQDGWMLTSVSANVDNSKMGDVLTAAIQALSGTVGGGGAAKATKAAASAPGGAPPQQALPPYDRALRPGLYAFDYDYGMSRISFLCAVAYFDSHGSRPTDPSKDAGACRMEEAYPSRQSIVSARY